MARTCSYFPKCGGCASRNLPYDKQLEQKTAYIKNLLKPFGGKVAPCVGGAEDDCRNKVHLAFCTEKGAVRAGFLTARPTGWCPSGPVPCTGTGMKIW